MATTDDFQEANRRAKELTAKVAHAIDAHYDRKTKRIVVHLSSKLVISFSPKDMEGLDNAGRPCKCVERGIACTHRPPEKPEKSTETTIKAEPATELKC